MEYEQRGGQRGEMDPWRMPVDIAGNVDNHIDVDSDPSLDNELLEEVSRSPNGIARPPIVVAPLVMDPGLWLNMVNVKPPYLLDLEIERSNKFILEYKRYCAQKCPRQLLRSMKQFLHEEHIDIYSEDGIKIEELRLSPIRIYYVYA